MHPRLGSGWSAEKYHETLDKLDRAKAGRQQNEDPHLRGGNTVMRYHVHATDGDIGHVQGILIDEKTWAIHYIIVHTSIWWLGHEVLIALEWVMSVNWTDSKVAVDVTRQAIQDTPPYEPTVLLDREYAARIHRHYGRDGYRLREPAYEPVIPHLGP